MLVQYVPNICRCLEATQNAVVHVFIVFNTVLMTAALQVSGGTDLGDAVNHDGALPLPFPSFTCRME